MNIFVAGGTGAIGRQLLPRLTAAGHTVTATTRTPAHVPQIRALGARPVVVDALDRQALMSAVLDAAPEVVIHQLTAIPHRIEARQIKRDLAQTNRLRTEGTRLLMEAARAAGTRLFVAQSIATYYAPNNTHPAVENDPLYTTAPSDIRGIVQALVSHEDTVLNTPGVDGIVLRYGYIYGPGTSYSADGSFTADVRRRRVPIIGSGKGVTSFIHVEDAAAATVLAMDHARPGVYNIVDDEPAPIREWLPVYAALSEAPRPLRVTRFIGKLAGGSFGLYFMTEACGASNAKAKHVLEWSLRYPSWRDGFRAELAPDAVPSGVLNLASGQ